MDGRHHCVCGNVFYVYQKVKDAGTLMDYTAGINANQVLFLDKDENFSVIGRIAIERQLRSSMKDGVVPIAVDSETLVKNLNAEYLNGLQSKDFTLAFVTKKMEMLCTKMAAWKVQLKSEKRFLCEVQRIFLILLRWIMS